MEVVLAALAIVVSLAAVAWQMRVTREQARQQRHAELLANAHFDLLRGFYENRRAQVKPVDDSLLRTSSATFYVAMLRLMALADDVTLEALVAFVRHQMRLDTGHPDSFAEHHWNLHECIVNELGYRPPPSKEMFYKLLYNKRRDTPAVYLGEIRQPESIDDMRSGPHSAAPPR